MSAGDQVIVCWDTSRLLLYLVAYYCTYLYLEENAVCNFKSDFRYKSCVLVPDGAHDAQQTKNIAEYKEVGC